MGLSLWILIVIIADNIINVSGFCNDAPPRIKHATVQRRNVAQSQLGSSSLSALVHVTLPTFPIASNEAFAGFQQNLGQEQSSNFVLQSAAVVATGLGFLVFDKRPRGSARNDLVEVRKSKLIKNDNLGVFAKTFIPKGTSLGMYPGFRRTLEEVYNHSTLREFIRQWIDHNSH